MTNFLSRVAAATRLLASLQGTPSCEAASAGQRDHLIAALGVMTYTADDAATMVDAVRQAGFCALDAAQIFAAIQQHVEGARGPSRCALQNYSAIHLDGSAAFWMEISQHKPTALAKLTRLAHNLGMRNPVETTVQRLAAILLMTTEDFERARCKDPLSLYEAVCGVKRALKALPRDTPTARLVELPSDPSCFQAAHPLMCTAVYSDASPPVNFPCLVQELDWLQAVIPMRKTVTKWAVVR